MRPGAPSGGWLVYLITAGQCRPAVTCVDTAATHGREKMSKLLRGIAAGWGAKKLGGGCISTILIFLLLWWLLGGLEIFR